MNEKVFTENEEIRITELYSNACDEVRAPKELYDAVTDMRCNTGRSRRPIGAIRKIAVVIAAFMVIVFGSNLIAYAATGTGWIGRILVAFNSSENQEITFREEKDSQGKTVYVGCAKDEKTGNSLTVVTYDPMVLQGVSFRVEGDQLFVTDAQGVEHRMKCYDDFEGFTAGIALVTPKPEK